ncbi:HNH endonuclease [Echinicola marina]|uniref:HNH endonuclease n=1 Tax=Echinicola marina TaxID=2859768 RepID=UPI001CF6B309|nr:HNH endonuclease [Echinicola marina]UCS95420.1 HNH endonuclease [Echinicola marina]
MAYQSGGITIVGAFLDHIAPRRLFENLEYEEVNYQHLCSKCHSQKMALEARIDDKDEWLREFVDGRLKFICEGAKRLELLRFL